MTKHKHQLSADMLFPACPSCESNLLVTRSPGCNTQFRCVPCEQTFNAPRDSEWFGVDQLPESHARDYVACEIRGLSVAQQARCAGVAASTVKTNVNDALSALRTMQAKAGGQSTETEAETGVKVKP